MNLNRRVVNLNGSPPADDESGVVFPTQAAWVHVRPQTDIVPQHICDPLFCTDVIDFNALKITTFEHFDILYFVVESDTD